MADAARGHLAARAGRARYLIARAGELGRPKNACNFAALHSRFWPGSQRRPQLLIGLSHAEHPEIIEAMPDDLEADRQAFGVITGADRDRRLLRHVERRSERDVLQGYDICSLIEL